MKLKSVWFKNYKSFGEWSEFSLEQPLIAVTGRNGVGKTNLLEALEIIFAQKRVRGDFFYKLVFAASDEELDEADGKIGGIKINRERRTIEAEYDGYGYAVSALYAESRKIEEEIERLLQPVRELFRPLHEDLEKYEELLRKIRRQYDLREESAIVSADTEGYVEVTSGIRSFKEWLGSMERRTEEFLRPLVDEEDGERVRRWRGYCFYGFPEENALKLKIELPRLSPLEEKFIKIDSDGLRRAVDAWNEETASLRTKILERADKLNDYCTRLNAIGERLADCEAREEEQAENFCKRLIAAVKRRAVILKAPLFVPDENGTRYHDPYGYLVEAFYRRCCKDGKEAEKKIEKSKSRNAYLTKDELSLFERMLNESLPKFERGLIEAVHAEYREGNLEIILEEVSGAQIPLQYANEGRRWYFSYYFLKNCLGKGDVFLIDEPGSSLHPDAQLEVFDDMWNLAVKKKVTVIYTTHSPYMIPEKIKSLRVLSLDGNGSHIRTLADEQEHIDALRAQMGAVGVNDFLLKVSKRIVFVEGKLDEACIRAFMRLFGAESSDYEIYAGYGHPAVPLAWTAMKLGVKKFKVLLDGDNLEKAEEFRNANPYFQPNLEELRAHGHVVFTSEDGSKREIEDLFAGEDRIRYLETKKVKKAQRQKVSEEKLEKLSEETVEEETKKNFKELFARLGISIQ